MDPGARPGTSLPSLSPCASFEFLSEARSLGPLSLPRRQRCLRKGCRPHWNAEAARRPGDGTKQGREGVGLAAPRDDAVEWGELGQLPEGEQASWALEL